jgi:LacI family transcriptional regulator
MQKRQPTMADLARELGVSTATISRALKGYPDISDETKRRVIELAERLNYRPNAFAASLRRNESKIIGVIVPEVVNHFFSQVIKGIMEVAYDAGFRVMLCQSDERYEKEVADAEALMDSRVDGMLVSLSHTTHKLDHFHQFQDLGAPIVFFDKVPMEFANSSKVIVDDKIGAMNAMKHLFQQGCKKIAHIGGPFIAYTAKNRFEGYKEALEFAGVTYDPSLVFECSQVTHEEGETFASMLIEKHPDVDGIFCVTDDVAIGALSKLKKLGKVIPDDIAIVGFSDWKMAKVVEPALSSVYQPGYEMGKRATEILLNEIQTLKKEMPVTHQVVTLTTDLRVRASSQRI